MIGYLLYPASEIVRNTFFIDKLVTHARSRHIHLILLEEHKLHFTLCDTFSVYYNGEQIAPPDFVINRGTNLWITQLFEHHGCRVYNNAVVSQMANDKLLSYSHILQLKIPFLGVSTIPMNHYPMVAKKRKSHGGKDVFMVKDAGQIPHACDDCLFQEAATICGHDVRFYVVGDQIVTAIMRKNTNDFRSNISLGGSAALYAYSEEQKATVLSIARSLNADYIGVDFILDGDTLYFNEIEDVVGARSVYMCTNIDIAELVISHIVSGR